MRFIKQPFPIEACGCFVQKVDEPTCLKAAWELMEVFYADKLSQAWLPERLVDWLAVSICLMLYLADLWYQFLSELIILNGRFMKASSQAHK